MSSPSSDAPIHFTREVTWVDSSCCQSCGLTSWIPWKHHCRACGGCFCQNCSSKSLALPPKHPTPVRVCDKCYNKFQGRPTQPTAKFEAGPPMSATLPVDFFTRKIDEYSGPRATPIDPMAASAGSFDAADSPKAKWLTDRPASYYYSAPPVASPAIEPVEEEAGEEEAEEKTEEQTSFEKASASGSSSSTRSETTTHTQEESRTEAKGGEEREETKSNEGGDDADEGAERHTPAGGEQKEDVNEGDETRVEGEERDHEHSSKVEEISHAVTEPTEPTDADSHEDANQTSEESNEKEGESNAQADVKEQIGSVVVEPSPSEPESGDAEETPVVAPNVDTEREEDGEAPVVDETSDTAVATEEPKQAAASVTTDEKVMQLKEIIKLTEEEDKEEKEKMEAIQNKLKNMRANTVREWLEVGSLALRELSSSIFYGLRDSLRVKHATISIQKSNRVYNHIIDTFILNGPLLLLMYILFKYLFEPHFHSMLNFKEHRGFTLVLVQIMEFLLKTSFLVLWVGPIYVLSVVLNMQWSQEIGNGAFSLYLYIRRGKTVQKASKPLSDTIAQITYWQVIFGVFNLLNFLCKFVPVVGPPFYFVCLCWLNAVYCFDYKWGNQKWSLHKKISYCETRWLYFIGFGLPITLATFFFEYIISYSLVSLLFPMFIPMAMYGSPKTQSLWKPIPMSRFLDSSIIAPLIRFIFTLPSQVEKLEQKADTIVRFLVFAVCTSVVLGVVTYLLRYLVY